MNDQFGRRIFRGDTVTLSGRVIDLVEDPNYVNCTVLLDQQMPPGGMQIRLDLNTVQVTKTNPGLVPEPVPQVAINSRLALERSSRQAGLVAIAQDLSHVRLMLQRLVEAGARRGEY